MEVKLHQPVEGRDAGATIEVDDERGNWLIANGYASKPRGRADRTLTTTVPAEDDPTLAANREAPDEDTPGVQTQETPATPEKGAAAQQDRTGLASGAQPLERDVPATTEQLAAQAAADARAAAIKSQAKADEKAIREQTFDTPGIDTEMQAKMAAAREKAADTSAPKVEPGQVGARVGDGSGASGELVGDAPAAETAEDTATE